ncbi:MAG: hypothetical protein MUF54_22970, partial [Polyangiaceae bacterium]|nr:hypothetical protein [Polyangiaceae bacterium]
STVGQTHAYAAKACNATGTSPDQVYQFNSGVGGSVTISIPTVGTTFDTLLYARQGACSGPGATEVACKDTSGKGGESISFQSPPNTNYWVFVDGFGTSASGDFRLEILMVPTCGNGTVDVGEQCDDGNKDAGDGCSESCVVEAACGELTEHEPNPYDAPEEIPAACGTFQIPAAAISPASDGDYFLLKGLPVGANVSALTYTGTPGTCATGTALVVSLWKAPIATAPGNVGSCAAMAGKVACAELTSNGNCSALSYTVPAGQAGDYIINVHSWGSGSTVPSYGLTTSIQ